MEGKLYSVWTDDEMSLVFNVYRDDTEALIAFTNLIRSIRKDIFAGVLAPDTDVRLSLYCHGYIKNGVIHGFKVPVRFSDGACILDEISVDDADLVPPVEESEVTE